jgi:hypothetical protein
METRFFYSGGEVALAFYRRPLARGGPAPSRPSSGLSALPCLPFAELNRWASQQAQRPANKKHDEKNKRDVVSPKR